MANKYISKYSSYSGFHRRDPFPFATWVRERDSYSYYDTFCVVVAVALFALILGAALGLLELML